MHLSLLSIGVSEGDEVITPSFNNAADFQAIKACGAEPVFVDIFEDTLCIDVTKIESLITEKTKCIIAMDYDIFLCDHDELKEFQKSAIFQFCMMPHIPLDLLIKVNLLEININTQSSVSIQLNP